MMPRRAPSGTRARSSAKSSAAISMSPWVIGWPFTVASTVSGGGGGGAGARAAASPSVVVGVAGDASWAKDGTRAEDVVSVRARTAGTTNRLRFKMVMNFRLWPAGSGPVGCRGAPRRGGGTMSESRDVDNLRGRSYVSARCRFGQGLRSRAFVPGRCRTNDPIPATTPPTSSASVSTGFWLPTIGGGGAAEPVRRAGRDRSVSKRLREDGSWSALVPSPARCSGRRTIGASKPIAAASPPSTRWRPRSRLCRTRRCAPAPTISASRSPTAALSTISSRRPSPPSVRRRSGRSASDTSTCR